MQVAIPLLHFLPLSLSIMLFIQIFFVFPLNPLLLLPSNLFRNNKPASYEEGGLKYIYEKMGGIWFPLLDGLSVCVHRSVRYWMMRFPDNRVTSSSWAKNGNVCVCVRAQVRGKPLDKNRPAVKFRKSNNKHLFLLLLLGRRIAQPGGDNQRYIIQPLGAASIHH